MLYYALYSVLYVLLCVVFRSIGFTTLVFRVYMLYYVLYSVI